MKTHKERVQQREAHRTWCPSCEGWVQATQDPRGGTAQEQHVMPPAKGSTQGMWCTRLSHDRQTQLQIRASGVIPLSQSFWLSFVISAPRGAGHTAA